MAGENYCRVRRCSTFLLLCSLSVLLAGYDGSKLQFPTQYQAVFLSNDQVFFGRLQGSGSPYHSLCDVFCIKHQAASNKKEVQNLLLKQGGEASPGPDFMRINARHVVLIEPVAPDSRVAQLILEAHKPPAAAPKV